MGFIKINKIKCLHCGDIVLSSKDDPNEVQKCGCGACGAFGGSSMMGRKGLEGIDFKELSEFDLSKYSGKISEEVAEEPPGNREIIDQILKQKKENS